MSTTVKKNLDEDKLRQLEVDTQTLDHAMANDECEFHISEENKMVHVLPISSISINSTKHTALMYNTDAFRYYLASIIAQQNNMMDLRSLR